MDLIKAKELLDRLTGVIPSNTKSNYDRDDYKYVLKEGKNTLRIVPWIHASREEGSLPFYELFFYYNLSKKFIVSPKTFGEEDPILDYASKLWGDGDEETAKKLFPTRSWSCPVIDRDTGKLQYWLMSKGSFLKILSIINSECGDVSHPETGRDIVVETKKSSRNANEVISIIPKMVSSPLTKEEVELVSSIRHIKSYYTPATNEELLKELDMKIAKIMAEKNMFAGMNSSIHIDQDASDFSKIFK